MSTLIDLLAQALVRDLNEHVLVIRLTVARGQETQRRQPLREGRDGVWRCAVAVNAKGAGDLGELLPAVQHAVATYIDTISAATLSVVGAAGTREGSAQIFLDPGDATAALPLPAIVHALGPLVTRLLLLTHAGDAAPPAPLPEAYGTPILHSILLGGDAAPRAVREDAVRLKFGRERELAALRSLPAEGQLRRLSPHAQASFARWARALTERRVGIALGGGGAYGYAHVELLRRLTEEESVPIDAISGASFGALVGAYFCAKGRAGLEQIVDDWPRIQRATRLAFVSSSALAHQIDRSLGRVLLEELEIPLLAVTTNLLDGSAHVPNSGSIGEAVRMSGSFPGLFAPTTTADGHFVDGAVINNVPDTLFLKGFGLVIASNIVPRPPRKTAARLPGGGLRRRLHEFNPWQRLRDAIHSCFLLMYSAGDHGFADVAFSPNLMGYRFWDFDKADAIMRDACPAAELAAEQARQMWRQLCHT